MTRDKKLQPGQKGKKDRKQQSVVQDATELLPQLWSPDWYTGESDEHLCKRKGTEEGKNKLTATPPYIDANN